MSIKHPFFSLIMPVYNAEKFLKKSISSILNQTFEDFELILVDDCSEDNSYKICSLYAARDSRIKILQNEYNSGASKTRNKGILYAVGKYIGFVDADDWIEIDVLNVIHFNLRETSVDCLKYGVIEEYFDKNGNIILSRVCNPKEDYCDNRDSIINKIIELEQYPLFGYCANGFYKMDIIKTYKLLLDETIKVNEDFDFNIRFFKFVKKFKVIRYSAYHYRRMNVDSLSSQKSNYSYDVHIKKVNALLELLDNTNDFTKEDVEKIFWLYVRFVYASLENGEDFNYIKMQAMYNKFCDVKFTNMTLKQRIMIAALKMGNSLFINCLIGVIRLTKNSMPLLFAKIKG